MLETYLRCEMCRSVVIVDGRMVPDRAARSGQVLWAKMNGKWGKRELGQHGVSYANITSSKSHQELLVHL
jgi:hypothetical protein